MTRRLPRWLPFAPLALALAELAGAGVFGIVFTPGEARRGAIGICLPIGATA